MGSTVRENWENFLNPEVVRSRLILASIYVVVFETLKDTTITRPRSFFWNGFNQDGDIIDERYKEEVLSRNTSLVFASLDWLRELGAIDEADMEAFAGSSTAGMSSFINSFG